MKIYLDNAATTPLCYAAAKAMEPFQSKMFFNPSAGYTNSTLIRNKIEECRERLAGLLNAYPDEIYFTSGGTESDNWAIQIGISGKKHIITQCTEHKAVLNKVYECQKNGYEITVLPVNSKGMVNPDELCEMLKPGTGIISIMYGNNEIGTIQPVEEIAYIAKKKKILFHTDAVQAFGHIPVDVKKSNVDMLSGSSHKFGGPKGNGFLYIKRGTVIKPLIYGGGQEKGNRSGTENVPGIIGMVTAAEIACLKLKNSMRYCRLLSNRIYERIMREIPDVIFNGEKIGDGRLPGNLNFCFKNIDANELLVMLDMHGICASAGSACNTSNGSYVLKAIGTPTNYIKGCLRLGIGDELTPVQADYVVESLKRIIEELRNKRNN